MHVGCYQFLWLTIAILEQHYRMIVIGTCQRKSSNNLLGFTTKLWSQVIQFLDIWDWWIRADCSIKYIQNGCHSSALPEKIGRSSLGRRTVLLAPYCGICGSVRELETSEVNFCGLPYVPSESLCSVMSWWVTGDWGGVGRVAVSEDAGEDDLLDCDTWEGYNEWGEWVNVWNCCIRHFTCAIVEKSSDCISSDLSISASKSSSLMPAEICLSKSTRIVLFRSSCSIRSASKIASSHLEGLLLHHYIISPEVLISRLRCEQYTRRDLIKCLTSSIVNRASIAMVFSCKENSYNE